MTSFEYINPIILYGNNAKWATRDDLSEMKPMTSIMLLDG
jgi:hypothetical protein